MSPVSPFQVQSEVEISQAGLKRLRQGHLWIYAADVVRQDVREGAAFVRVFDPAGNLAGYALYSGQSQIRLRFFSKEAESPTEATLMERVRASIERRRPLRTGSACRLVFGESDLLPSIIVDRYSDYLVLQTLSAGAEALKSSLVEILRELIEPAGIYERNDVKARCLEGLEEVSGVLWGEVPQRVEIVEGGTRFLVDIVGGQKTGFFLDQSENRITAGKYATGNGLDCFTNTGGFALHMAGRCESVIAVDTSQDALELGRRNAEINGFTNVSFQAANAFDLLRELERKAEKFSIVCLDPPAFAKNRASLRGAIGGYKEINLRAMKLLRPGGILITSSCSYHLSEERFGELLQQAAHDARLHLQLLERRAQACDHPVLLGMPETHYLKCFVLRAL